MLKLTCTYCGRMYHAIYPAGNTPTCANCVQKLVDQALAPEAPVQRPISDFCAQPESGEAATGPGEVRSDPVVKKRSHKTPPKHKGRPVLKEEEFAVLMERLGPCPVKGSLEDVKRWMAEKTVLTILNRANRDAVLLAQAILKTNTGSLPGMPAPEAKPESAGSKADAPVQRRREE